jgi:DNA-binding beta-propeller fold protein YncE
LSGADLEQGIYDASRKVYYFADQSKIQVLSLGSGWQTPITLPGTGANTQLLSLSLSPNGSKLAISDYGDLRIYVLDPSSPGSVQSYAVKQPTVQGANSAPTGLCITDNGVIYYAVDYLGGSGGPTFEKLDTTTNTTTILGSGGGILTDVRVLLSPDGSRVYVDFQSLGFYLDTATDKITLSSGPGLGGGVPDFSMSADGTTLAADGFVVDSILNPTGIIEYVDRETWLPQATFGQKLNKDGSVLFQPLTDGIDVLDVQTGRLVNRVQLPIQLPSVYDSLVVDGQDALVAAITTSGVVTIDLSSVTPSHADVRHVLSRQEGASRPGGGAGAPQSKLAGTASILANRPSLKRATRAPAVKIPTRYR